MALQAYATSLASLEKSRVDAYQQQKYLVTIGKPTKPESTSYPAVGYNVTLFAVLLLLLYGIARIVIATILELK
jgi:capsular polysaccharide transport system permease protein